jgi:hypothetical protein
MPPGTYVLARYECIGFYTGPDWVPFNLWSNYEYAGDRQSSECAKKLIFSPGARELWAAIAEKYERPDNIAATLPRRCAEFTANWKATPKATPGDFRRSRQELKKMAETLAHELERFFHHRDPPDESGTINFTQLLTEEEQDSMDQRILWHNYGIHNYALKAHGHRGVDYEDFLKVEGVFPTYELLLMDDRSEPGIVPDLPSLLRRIGAIFADDGQTPPLQRPNAANAERNYFVRRLIRYFKHECGEASPTIIAAIVSFFFAQGITDNEVSKQMNVLPDGRPWPPSGSDEAETSPLK